MDDFLALKVHDDDNVATVFSNGVGQGDSVVVRDKRGGSENLTVISNIPYGHKVALVDISAGEKVVKYGESLGVVVKPINKGEWVHVHNMDSLRGRGDQEEGHR